MRRRWRGWWAGLALALAAAGCSGWRRPGSAVPGAPGPGLAGVLPAPGPAPAATLAGSGLGQRLQAYLQGRPGEWSVWVEDLGSGEVLALDADRYHAAASTLKLPLALWLMERWSRGELDLDERLPYTAADREEGTGILLHRAPGGRYPVRTLLGWALTHSDNVATRMLLRRYGREELLRYMRARGGRPEVRDGLTHVTAREMGLYLRVLWRGEQLAPAARDQLLSWLTRTVFPTRLQAGVPAAVPVAHKIGTLAGAVHDVGIVLHPLRPYSIALMSSGAPEGAAEETMARISALVWAQMAGTDPGRR